MNVTLFLMHSETMNHRVLLAISVIVAFLLIIIGLLVVLVAHSTHNRIIMRCDTSVTPWECMPA